MFPNLRSKVRSLFAQVTNLISGSLAPEAQERRPRGPDFSAVVAEHLQAYVERPESEQMPVVGQSESGAPQVGRPDVAESESVVRAAPPPPRDKRTLLRLATSLGNGRIVGGKVPLPGAGGVCCSLPEDTEFEGEPQSAQDYLASIVKLRAVGVELLLVSWVGPQLTGGTREFQFEGRSFDIGGYDDYNLAREHIVGQELPRFGRFIQGGSPVPLGIGLENRSADETPPAPQFLNQGLMLFFPSDEVAKAFAPPQAGSLWYWVEWRMDGAFAHFKLPQLATNVHPNRLALHELTDAILCQNFTDPEKYLAAKVLEARRAGAWVGCLEWVGEQNSVPLWFELNGVRVFVGDRESLCRNPAVRHVASGIHIKLGSRPFVGESAPIATGEQALPDAAVASDEVLSDVAVEQNEALADVPQLMTHQRALIIWDRDLIPHRKIPRSDCA